MKEDLELPENEQDAESVAALVDEVKGDEDKDNPLPATSAPAPAKRAHTAKKKK